MIGTYGIHFGSRSSARPKPQLYGLAIISIVIWSVNSNFRWFENYLFQMISILNLSLSQIISIPRLSVKTFINSNLNSITKKKKIKKYRLNKIIYR